jgi:ElaB/YqjD/DUF883 family membrane-anchored ribosome-binding protein
MEEAMGNSMESAGQQSQPTGDGSIGAPRVNQSQTGIKDTAIAQGETLIDKAKNTAQDRARSTVGSRKNQAVETVSGLAQSLLLAGQNLQNQQSPAAKLVQQAGERLDRAAQYLQTTEPDELVRRTESWARQNPALFIGGAFVVGILGARFLKSSRPQTNLPSSAGEGTAAPFSDREISRSPAVEGV